METIASPYQFYTALQLHHLLLAAIIVPLLGLPVSQAQTTPGPSDSNICPLLVCYNNATTHTLHCVYDRYFESILNWTLEDGLTVPRTSRAYSDRISFLTFDYSSLPFGYHPMRVFYHYHEDSPLGSLCSNQHCTCAFSFTLDISDGEHASQADIKLSGSTSKVSLVAVSKKNIDFRKLLQNMKTFLKELERPRG